MTDHLRAYVFVLVFSGVVMTVLTAVGWQNRAKRASGWFTAQVGLGAMWAYVAAGMVLVPLSAVRLRVEPLFIALGLLAPVAWFGFVATYTGYRSVLTRGRLALIAAVPLAVAVGGAVDPSLVFRSMSGALVGGLSLVHTEGTVLLWGVLLYNYLLVFVGLAMISQLLYTEANGLFTGQSVALALGSIVPVALGLVRVFDAEPVPGLPITPAALSVTGVAYGYALFRHRLFDVVPATRRIGETEALQDLTESVVIADRDNSVIEINESAQQTFELSAAETLGMDVRVLFEIIDAPHPNGLPAEFEYNTRTYEVTSSTVEDAGGQTLGRTFVFRDVTGRRDRQQRLSVLNRVFRHNIRNEMSAALTTADYLADPDIEMDRDLAVTLRERCESVVAISEKARTVEKMTEQEVNPTRVDLAALLDSIETRVTDDHGPFDLTAEGTAISIVTDGQVLETVLENVIENAVEHTGWSVKNGLPTVTVRVEERLDYCRIEIEDDGPGIPATELAVIERGTETDFEHGSGLGLWVIRWGMDRLGGDIRFESDEDGTTVTLLVPAFEAPDSTTDADAPAETQQATD